MSRRFLLPRLVLGGLLVAVSGAVACADDEPEKPAAADAPAETTPGVQFAMDFQTVSGATLTTTNGHDEQREGTLHGMYAAYAKVPEGQPRPLTLRVTEESSIKGPDGKPGVLRMQYSEVPIEAQYSGFLLYGSEEAGKMLMPGWSLGQVTMADLRRTFVEFKFRADNPNDPDDFGAMFQFRIEPEHTDSYNVRGDFGVLIATQRWRTFRRPIGSASNLEAFLKVVNEQKPEHFKLVWGQQGPIQGYHPGDSLLIDDLKVVIE